MCGAELYRHLLGLEAPLTPEQREQIEAVTMDMWEPYQYSVHTHVPKASEKNVGASATH